jgi:hypothetical protein
MLCTLVMVIGTFLYALRVVVTPWSLDQDNKSMFHFLLINFFLLVKGRTVEPLREREMGNW